MATKHFSAIEAIGEWLNGNPEVGNTDPVTIMRGTAATIVGSWYVEQTYGGLTWRQTYYTDATSTVVAISAVTTV